MPDTSNQLWYAQMYCNIIKKPISLSTPPNLSKFILNCFLVCPPSRISAIIKSFPHWFYLILICRLLRFL